MSPQDRPKARQAVDDRPAEYTTRGSTQREEKKKRALSRGWGKHVRQQLFALHSESIFDTTTDCDFLKGKR